MRRAAVALVLLFGNIQAADRVVVYLESDGSVSQHIELQAEGIAERMFARIGVVLDWHAGSRRRNTAAIQVSIVRHVPAGTSTGTLGYTELRTDAPAHIFLFPERFQHQAVPDFLVLAHVLVHEITHAIQGEGRHSPTGVMKANWTFSDYTLMSKMLQFTPEDVEIIHKRLARR